jgi:2-C-methyl-D-erythritol 4-phosphate cytidylyltransferase/2-C-methyl-D-erythritol 2,4-cyclodiphosphate synthase
MSTPFTTAIVPAAGRGQRAGTDRPKQFVDLGGQTMLELTLAALAASARIHEIVVALPEAGPGVPPALRQASGGLPVRVVAGGPRRQDSVAQALAAVDPRTELVAVHDAARPFVSTALIERTLDAAARHGAAIAALPVHDTVKQSAPPGDPGGPRVNTTLPRATIFLAQTPQAFRRDVLVRAFDAGGREEATDEAMLAERAGIPVYLVEGEAANVKVTTMEDLKAARRRLQGTVLRVGLGYDLHRLVEGRPLILAGVRIPFDLGLDGHSDADVICHAVTDAVLGAAGLGDIGRLYPDTDPAWKDADSLALLAGVAARLDDAALAVVNVDVTVIAQRPKLVPHIDAMRANLARALNVDPGAVSVKGKTNEGVDSMGRGESMACHAVALVGARG